MANTYIDDLVETTTPAATVNLIVDNGTDTKRATLANLVKAALAALPTTDPGVAGEPWLDNGTVKVSNGP